MWINAEYAPYNVELRVKTYGDRQFFVTRTRSKHLKSVWKINCCDAFFLDHDVMSYWYAT